MQRAIDAGLEGVEGKVLYHSYNDVPVESLLLSLASPQRAIFSTSGFVDVTAVCTSSGPPSLWDSVRREWDKYSEAIARDMGYEQGELAVLSTIAGLDNLGRGERVLGEHKVVSFAVADVSTNAVRMGADEGAPHLEDESSCELGAVNIILLTNASLTDGDLTRSLVNVTEGKVRAFQDMDVRSSHMPMHNQATGTNTDNAIVVSGSGPSLGIPSGRQKMSEMIAETAYQAVKDAVAKQNNLFPHRPVEDRLKERGIAVDALVEAGLEMYIPDLEIGGKDEVRSLLKKQILSSFGDINICSLIVAGLKLEDAGRRALIPTLTEEEYLTDPVHLIVDELLGIQVATYIAGSRALFEFERFDRRKPGILSTLPPILDDVIGGLISGCLVKICS